MITLNEIKFLRQETKISYENQWNIRHDFPKIVEYNRHMSTVVYEKQNICYDVSMSKKCLYALLIQYNLS
jgi:hypothetical protein